jgi:hypothetical protein
MLVALLFSFFVVCSGYSALRALRLAKSPAQVGLVVPAGLATLAVASTWLGAIPLPAPTRGIAVAILVAAGLASMARDRAQLLAAGRSLVRTERPAAALLALSLFVPAVSLGIVFWGVEVPLSPHDGAYHAELTSALRAGQPFAEWYPPGTIALFAAVLQLLPWVDTARGTFELGLALAIMAPVVVFGLGLSVWRNVAMASAGALALSLTYLFPYFPQIWSGWPLAASMLLAFGVWSVGVEYVEQPSWRWALLAGGLLGAIVVVHGTELYSLAPILVVLVAFAWRRLPWTQLPAHLVVAALVALVCALPYLPLLLHWAGGGGASRLGYEAGQVLEDRASTFLGEGTFLVFLGGALGIDTPIRLVLAAVGAWFALRSWTGRTVLGAGLLFLAIALSFALLNSIPLVRAVYAATFPWGMSYRTLIVVGIAQSLLAGAGLVVLACKVRSRWTLHGSAKPPSATRRRVGRLARLLVITWGLLAFSALVFTLSITRVVVGFTDDDDAAMRWLRANASPGAVVANDSYADAGIWIPDKTGLSLVRQRAAFDPTTEPLRAQVLGNVAHLDHVRDAACALRVQYVYSGAQVSDWDQRRFPPLEELRASPSLEEVFSQGKATIFRVRLGC